MAIVKTCLQCGIGFKDSKPKSRPRKFCSHPCYGKSKVGKVAPTLGFKYPFKERPWQKGLLVGARNPRWIADRSKLVKKQERNDSAYFFWRKSVLDRDGQQCKIADSNCLGKIVAHHILPWAKFVELRYQINNGISLCHYHHPRKRSEEMELSPFFQELVLKAN